jgi:DNA-directed RNA polymerase specialized sigma24 family protein
MTGAAPGPDAPPTGRDPWGDLLAFLDPGRAAKQGPDRDAEAHARCVQILRKLTCFFAGRGCRDAEDLAVECVARVADRCGSLDASAPESRAAYFYGVARNVLRESWRASRREAALRDSLRSELARRGVPGPPGPSRTEAVHRCLERCMGGLTRRAQALVLGYYGAEGAARIDSHRNLAVELGKSVNALRIEVHRIRATLRRCVLDCVPRGEGDAPPPGHA